VTAAGVRTTCDRYASSVEAVAVANPLRSLAGDAAYVRDVIAGIGKPVVLVGHSYGGMVITEAAATTTPWSRSSTSTRSHPNRGRERTGAVDQVPGSTLGEALAAYPVSIGGNEFVIRPEAFHHQLAGDVAPAEAALMGDAAPCHRGRAHRQTRPPGRPSPRGS
jgi:pimeloyl-ACP methyl ester carboxylesterase